VSERPLRLSVVVPTICRPEELRACLESLAAQSRAADQVVVVLPTAASACDEVAASFGATTVRGSERGIVAAVNAGLAAADGDVICLIDDDATAPAHWLARIEGWFRRPGTGAVGGPNVAPGSRLEDLPPVDRWDRLTWFGWSAGPRTWGRTAGPQRAHFLQEDNLAFRADAVRRVDTRLTGRDERFGDDITLGLLRRGLRVVADPQVFVWHGHVRFAFDPERVPTPEHVYATAHNQTYLWLKHLPAWRRVPFLLVGLLVGDRTVKGLGAFAAWLGRNLGRPARALAVLGLVGPTLRGRVDGIRTWRTSRG
jgi:glycosyltransferase involved in cell wall biosynthesis